MMSYSEWMAQHSRKHTSLVNKLRKQSFSTEAIIAYFDFENMLINEVDFCPLYAEGKKCHDMENLNCYMCACPYFRYADEGIETLHVKDNKIIKYSTCSINHKSGVEMQYGNAIHQDCSNCTVPHTTKFITRHYLDSFDSMMCETSVSEKT